MKNIIRVCIFNHPIVIKEMIKCFLKPIIASAFDPAVSVPGSTSASSSHLPVPCTEPIELKNGQDLILGRGPVTKITDSKCSRNQIQVRANFGKRVVSVQQLGPNNSALNDEPIGIGLNVIAKSGDVINLLLKEDIGTSPSGYRYEVYFEGELARGPSTSMTDSNPKPTKIPKMFTDLKHKDKKTSNGAVASDFLKSAPDSGQGTWDSVDSGQLIVYKFMDPKPAANVAAFDMDGTLITTQSGRVFPKDDRDWKFYMNNTVAKLQSFWKQHQESTRIVIISNQAGLAGKPPAAVTGFKKKVETILGRMAIPCIFFACTDKASKYRKPLPYLWHLFTEQYNGGIEPGRTESFYCGDAAGRKKDFSCSDRLFALNLGLVFKTPEEFFLGSPSMPFNLPNFNPSVIIENPKSNSHIKFPSGGKEIIIMVGFPGSGKSQFVRSMLVPRGYVHVNRDTLKTAAKCLSTSRSALEAGDSVVVDNTNPKKKDRAEYIELGKRYGGRVRCLKMDVGFDHASHNNKFRQLTDPSHAPVPAVAFNTYRAQFEEPEQSEGFDEILPIHFVPEFKKDADRILYGLYLLEK